METTTIALDALEVRDAGGGKHELEGVCVPYDTVTTRVAGPPELFRPGAFKTAASNAAKIRLFEDHDTDARPVGVGVAFTDTPHALEGRFRFYDTPQGRAAFENAREGTYGGLSVGFAAVRDQVTATGREVLEAILHHVGMVGDPAYNAPIIGVRNADPAADRYALFRNAPTVIDLAALPVGPQSARVRRALGE